MKQSREYPVITVSKKAERALKSGHPWVYEQEIRDIFGEVENGCLVDVCALTQNPDRDFGSYLGTGLLSEHSKIRIRLISRNANDKFDAAFWERRIRYAWEYRKSVMGTDIDCCRLIYGESDQFPGLTVDRFHDILVAQTLCYGMEKLKPLIFPLLYKVLNEDGQEIRGIYERNDVSLREREGLSQCKGWYPLNGAKTSAPITEICENGISYEVDVENGQKTGYFLDQKYNRLAVRNLAAGRQVLDCFTHTGSFALNAAKGGAAGVCAVDISADAIRMAEKNAARNGLADRIDFRVADVFDFLTQLDAERERKFDFIILDPPAFTKSRRTVKNAEKGYKEINLRAMKLLPRGGYLATCSCSHFMTDELFVRMLSSAASDAGVQLKQIEARGQAPDHPVLWNVPETEYLKFYLFQVI